MDVLPVTYYFSPLQMMMLVLVTLNISLVGLVYVKLGDMCTLLLWLFSFAEDAGVWCWTVADVAVSLDVAWMSHGC